MTARVLVVDDVAANVKLLEARLSAEYFDVITAMSGSSVLTKEVVSTISKPARRRRSRSMRRV